MYKNIDELFLNLSKSKFRSSFKLKEKDIEYINKKGLEEIEKHAYKFITERLSADIILNDGKQTPMKGHPVFIAEHATATCCRGCLYKWHNIPQHRKLTEKEIKYIVSVIMYWIKREYNDIKC